MLAEAFPAMSALICVEEDYFQISRIRPWLCLSGKHPEQLKDQLEEHGVTHILQVRKAALWHNVRAIVPQ
jgi:hypothetical protein